MFAAPSREASAIFGSKAQGADFWQIAMQLYIGRMPHIFAWERLQSSLAKTFSKIFANFVPEKSYYIVKEALTVAKRLVTKQRRKVRQRAILISGVGGDIQFADQAARLWLKQFFGRPTRNGFLPRQVYRWISKPARNGRSLVAKTSTAQLYLKREPSYTDTDDNLVLLFELIKGKSEERLRRHRQLTPRERQVLFWVARGKSNSETGTILGISPSTVGKHLERIYQKLGVENRTAASSFGFEH